MREVEDLFYKVSFSIDLIIYNFRGTDLLLFIVFKLFVVSMVHMSFFFFFCRVLTSVNCILLLCCCMFNKLNDEFSLIISRKNNHFCMIV